MLQLSTLQKLLLFSAIAWAIWPVWGALAFSACVLMLALGTLSRLRAARGHLASQTEALEKLSDEPRALIHRFPLTYLWPNSAQSWGTTWQYTGLLTLLVSAVTVVRALLTQQWWMLSMLATLPVVLIGGGLVGRYLRPEGRFTQDLAAHSAAHHTLQLWLNLRRAAGFWPPAPSPDPMGDTEKPQTPPPPPFSLGPPPGPRS